MNSFFSDGRVERIASSLSKVHDVSIIGLHDYKKDYMSYYKSVPVKLIQISTKKLSKHPIVQIFKYIEYYIKLFQEIKKQKPDILYCNDIYTILIGYIFKKKGVRFIYDSHELWSDTEHHRSRNAILFKLLVIIEKNVIKHADLVISVGREILKILECRHKLTKSLLIMNIPDLRYQRFSTKTYSLSNSIVYIGDISTGRGLANIIHSVKLWREGVDFKIFGGGGLKDELEELVVTLSLSERIEFCDYVQQSEVINVFQQCLSGIHAIENTCLNHLYCLPNKFFQITLAKKPILVSNMPEMKKIIDAYHLGFTFDPNDINDIAKCVNRLIDEKFRISEESYVRYSDIFSWKNEEKKLLNAINELL